MRWENTLALLLSAILAQGCSGETSTTQPDGPQGDASVDHDGDAPPPIDAAPDAATQCSSPEGIRVCRGPANCPEGGAECKTCTQQAAAAAGACLESWPFVPKPCWLPADGDACASIFGAPDDLWAVPFSVAELYARNGAGADSVRYADFGLFTGEPLPAPSTCPSAVNVPACGGACGGCPTGRKCTGRSPLHPFGLCVPDSPTGFSCTGSSVISKPESCPKGSGCFTFQVEAKAQPLADRYSFCLPILECVAAAASLPGGGECLPPG